ncbi:MAG: single-stranded DNA-binding protein [Erysipelothrix sp.]|nr:single-stranded DNA-binding protein [Erysipelothrix sp.]
MINRTILVGRITHDPEVKKTPSGSSVVNFSLAVNRTFNKDQTDFINCVAWRNQADFIGNYIKKGTLLGVEGRIETGSYEDQTGRKVNTFTIVCDSVQALESRNARQNQEPSTYQRQEAPSFSQPAQAPAFEQSNYEDDAPTLDITNDDLPF